jgi:hypothetical protein
MTFYFMVKYLHVLEAIVIGVTLLTLDNR